MIKLLSLAGADDHRRFRGARGPATQLPVPAGYSGGPDRADVMRPDYVFG